MLRERRILRAAPAKAARDGRGAEERAMKMAKTFNVTAVCIPEEHYMVRLDDRLREIKDLIDAGKYFSINRARQYGKSTLLMALEQYLQRDYRVVSLDFQTFDDAKFQNGCVFAAAFAKSFLRALQRDGDRQDEAFRKAAVHLERRLEEEGNGFALMELFEELSDICAVSDRPMVLMIDEVDSATNNQVFLDFLAQLRAYYIRRTRQPTFRSVILAGVCDVKNLRMKIRPEDEHRMNSPWNIAADFKVDMSFSQKEIAGMLEEYEADWQTSMDTGKMAGLIYEYTSGYPFLVSRLCKLMDEEVGGAQSTGMPEDGTKTRAWTEDGFHKAVRMILSEKNTLFESLIGKLTAYPVLNTMLRSLLFTGKSIVYNADDPSTDTAFMYGFIRNQDGMAVISNRLFETRLYNYYLSLAEMQSLDIYKASLQDKSQFIMDGYLNMRRILEKFVLHFHELYSDKGERFVEEEGRKYFLLYLRPIINGTGNYYVESRTRDLRRTDVIVDYRGEQYVIEMKVWRGEEYNRRGEKQLIGYLDDYHKDKGYMVSFNFNKNKQIGVREIAIGGKTLIEAVV